MLPIKNRLIEAKNYISDSVKTAFALNLAPYILPTLFQDSKNPKRINMKPEDINSRDETFGKVALTLVGWAAQAFGYYELSQHVFPFLPLIPVATNTLDGIYETGIYLHQKLKQGGLEKRF